MNELENTISNNEQVVVPNEDTIQDNSTEESNITLYSTSVDFFRQDVLSYLDEISSKDSQIIENQNTIILQQQGISNTHTVYLEVLIFFMGLFIIVDVFRHMIKKV